MIPEKKLAILIKQMKNSKWGRENDVVATRFWYVKMAWLHSRRERRRGALTVRVTGKKLTTNGTLLIGGVDPFKMGLEGVTYLGLGIITLYNSSTSYPVTNEILEWVLNPIVRNDIYVYELLASVGGDAYPSRRDELIRILDIDVDWRMHQVSDGTPFISKAPTQNTQPLN